jgi:hypothetical protein
MKIKPFISPLITESEGNATMLVKPAARAYDLSQDCSYESLMHA